MTLEQAIEILEYHQKWRLGEIKEMIYPPKKLTQAIDVLLDEFKNKGKQNDTERKGIRNSE